MTQDIEALVRRLEATTGFDGSRHVTVPICAEAAAALRAQQAEIEGMKIELYGVPLPENGKVISIIDLHTPKAKTT